MNNITNITDRLKWDQVEGIVIDNFQELANDPKTREYLVAVFLTMHKKTNKMKQDHFNQKWKYFAYGILSGAGSAYAGFLLGAFIDRVLNLKGDAS